MTARNDWPIWTKQSASIRGSQTHRYARRRILFFVSTELPKGDFGLSEVIRLDPRPRSDAFWCLAAARAALHNINGAIADFTKAIELDPKSSAYYLSRGIAFRDKGEVEKAIADLSEAIRLVKGNSFYYLTRGRMHRN